MKEYIFGERNGIHIIDLQKTLKLFREASRFVGELSASGRPAVHRDEAPGAGIRRGKQTAAACLRESRWLGGTLTNWATLQKSIKRLKTLKA